MFARFARSFEHGPVVGAGADRPHVVIVGAGFGGLNAARALKDAPVRVTLIDRHNHHLFQPLLYQVAIAGLSPADISAPVRSILREQRNAEVILGEVTGVDVSHHRVLMGSRAVDYDYLVLATGAGTSFFGHDEWRKHALPLKTLEDGITIRHRILQAFEAAEQEGDPQHQRELLTFVIVGAGPTGVELAGAIAELAQRTLASEFRHIDAAAARVILVEAGKRILPTFPEGLAWKTQRALDQRRVTVRTGKAVEHIDATGVEIGGERIAARTVIWAAGVSASPAGRWLGTTTDRAGRAIVQPDLTAPGHPEIYVIGDTASVRSGKATLPGLSPVAIQQGKFVARAIMQRLGGREDVKPFRYLDKGNLATVGRSFAVANIRGLQLSGLTAWLIWVVVHIAYLISYRNRLSVMFQWGWAYLTNQRGARLIVDTRASALGNATPVPAETVAGG